jgi:hypothetical protein
MNGRFKFELLDLRSRSTRRISRKRTTNSNNFGVTAATAPTNMRFNTSCPASEQITLGVKDGLLPPAP